MNYNHHSNEQNNKYANGKNGSLNCEAISQSGQVTTEKRARCQLAREEHQPQHNLEVNVRRRLRERYEQK